MYLRVVIVLPLQMQLCLIPVCHNSINTDNNNRWKHAFLPEQQIDFSSFLYLSGVHTWRWSSLMEKQSQSQRPASARWAFNESAATLRISPLLGQRQKRRWQLVDTTGRSGGKELLFTVVLYARVGRQHGSVTVVHICILTSNLVTSEAFIMNGNQRMDHQRDLTFPNYSHILSKWRCCCCWVEKIWSWKQKWMLKSWTQWIKVSSAEGIDQQQDEMHLMRGKGNVYICI